MNNFQRISLVIALVLTMFVQIPQTLFAEDGEKDIATCTHEIERWNLLRPSDRPEYAFLSIATFFVPEREDSCSFFYTIKSPILEAFYEEIGNPDCTIFERSVTCTDVIESGSYVKIHFYTKGVLSEVPLASVEDFSNNNENQIWLFWGQAMFIPTVKS